MAGYLNGNLAYNYERKEVKNVPNIKKTSSHQLPVKEKLFYLFSVIFIVSLAGIVISGYALIAEYNYSSQKLEKSISDIKKENEQIQINIAELSSPDRIIQIAQNELGMNINEQQIIVISQSLN